MTDLPSTITDTDRKKIQGALKEMSDSMTRTAAEKDLQKEIAAKILEDCNVGIYHASNLMEEASRNDEFMEFANQVMASPANQIEN